MHKSPMDGVRAPAWVRAPRVAVLACAVLALALALMSLVRFSDNGKVRPLPIARPVSDTNLMPGLAPAGQKGGTVPAAAPAYVTVHIKNYAFAPQALSVASGTTVTWINDDTASHTVTTTSGPKSFDSKELKTGQSFSFTFVTAGTYAYYCAYHPDMKATVTVAAAPKPSPTPTPSSQPSGSPIPTPTGGPSGMPTPMPTSPGGGGQCTGALSGILNTVLQHIYVAHLDRSPAQQVTDLLALDQYVKTHTAWVQMILQEGSTEAQQALTGLIPLLQHLYMAHLEQSPGDQVAAILNIDQYVLTHTVLVEDILKPGLDGLVGGGSC